MQFSQVARYQISSGIHKEKHQQVYPESMAAGDQRID
jgi:hypothetical protein